MGEIKLNNWTKTARLDRKDIIRFQILVHCHLSSIKISATELETLTLIGVEGIVNLKPFAIELSNIGIFASEQSSRNSIARLQKLKLIVKSGKDKRNKTLILDPSMLVQTEGNILVDIKCAHYN